MAQVQLALDGVELKLYALELGADARRDLLAKVGDTQRAAQEHAQQSTQEEDQHIRFPSMPPLARVLQSQGISFRRPTNLCNNSRGPMSRLR